MARRRNPAHRAALLSSATQLIAGHGVGVTTAAIADQAGVSPGTLFNSFETKSALLNVLFVSLKCEMGRQATRGLVADAPPEDQLRCLWNGWVGWATSEPDKRRALAHLDVAAEITDDSREVVHRAMTDSADVLEGCRAGGPMQVVPLGFVLQILTAIANTTIDDLIARPGSVVATDDPRSKAAFHAIWRAVAS